MAGNFRNDASRCSVKRVGVRSAGIVVEGAVRYGEDVFGEVEGGAIMIMENVRKRKESVTALAIVTPAFVVDAWQCISLA